MNGKGFYDHTFEERMSLVEDQAAEYAESLERDIARLDELIARDDSEDGYYEEKRAFLVEELARMEK